jgi:ATP synthase protein I
MSVRHQGTIAMAASTTPPDGGPGKAKGDLTPQERDAFQQRADELGKRLDAAKAQSTTLPKPAASRVSSADNGNALGRAMRVSTELIGGIIVGAGLGWLIDKALGTWPAFFIILFLLGAAAGMMTVVRAGTSMKTGPNNPNAGPSVRDDDER